MELVRREQRSRTDSFEQVGLQWFEFDESSQYMQNVEQFRRVFGGPMIRLDFAQGRRLPSIPNHRTFAILFAVAEPLPQNLFARDLIRPNFGRNAIDVSCTNHEATFFRIVIDGVGHGVGLGGNGAADGNFG